MNEEPCACRASLGSHVISSNARHAAITGAHRFARTYSGRRFWPFNIFDPSQRFDAIAKPAKKDHLISHC
ncbi:hypothetical protein HW090_02040 [Pseudomonas sp. ABC1]|uniref:hypothetical protein n=1 Tax=Pseudomonas sp. ABC1 TaxID=2748080 RepID=UPI0015C3C986|nr:hypothetical protein [Pseudomonas sp. ABC1]QLF92050.1 hypothetical protein HW090_02040 [Pseudomonas sp. ABC1]